jgi:hypothetical protein
MEARRPRKVSAYWIRSLYMLTLSDRQQPDTRKQIWLITYGSASDDIDQQTLKDVGINVDECYTAAWHESKYTLFHCPRKDRVSMEAMKQATKSMINASASGYDSLSSTEESLENHPGFKKMVQLLNNDSKDLRWWIQDVTCIREYRKGLLWKYIDSTDPEKMTHKQLVSRVKAWAPIVHSHETLQEAYSSRLQAKEQELQQLNAILTSERETSARHIKELLEEKELIRNQLIDAGLRPLDLV